MKTAFAFCAGLVLLAGCLDTPAPTDATEPTSTPADVWSTIQGLMEGVPCEVPSVGTETSPNLKKLASILPEELGKLGEIDLLDQTVVLARYGLKGFDIVNVSDPLEPIWEGRFEPEKGGGTLDAKLTPDGRSVVFGAGADVHVVDITNRAEPQETHVYRLTGAPGGLNAHMLATARIAGSDWVFVAPNDGQGVQILKLEGAPEQRKVVFVARTLPAEGGALGPHDMTVQFDETLKRWVLYVADGFHGWLVFDINDPSKPMPLGGFIHPSTGYTHTIQASKIGTRRIVATIEEVGYNIMKVYDATDLRAPILLATWQDQPGPKGIDPQHNLHFVGSRLYMAHDGHGFFVFNFTKLAAAAPAPTPTLKPEAHYADSGAGGFVGVWEVLVDHGMLYMSHRDQGLVVIGYGCNKPGDAGLKSFG